MVVSRKKLERELNKYLNIYDFKDYGPNGLQVEGREEITKVAFAVSATKESIKEAITQGADTLIVHHGLFWSFHGTKPLKGPFAKRVFPLVKNDINLFGYHLPLDAHEVVGNAAQIADKIDLINRKPFGDHKGSPTGISGSFRKPIKATELSTLLETTLSHTILHSSPDDNQMIKSIGIITGGANSDWILSMKQGLDAYLTGEMSEHDWHESKESGVHMFAGGHNATEQFGVQALMKKVEKDFDLECIYIPSENPA